MRTISRNWQNTGWTPGSFLGNTEEPDPVYAGICQTGGSLRAGEPDGLYKDIYVYCDSDPIGYYLNQNHIRYHAVEDGLNCLKNFDAARYDNRGHFKIKAFLSMYLNLIFVTERLRKILHGYGSK